MMKLVDPIKLLIEKASTGVAHPLTAGALLESDVPYETALTPPPGAKVMRLTVAGTYRTAIPILFDPVTRTAYPLPSNG